MKPTDLRGILQYVPHFRDKIFVIAVNGEIVTHENFANILLDVAVLRSLNIRIVLVHGASHQIHELAKESGVAITNADGTGVTDAATLKLAISAANQLTHEILEGLSANDLRAAYANCIKASPIGILQGVDYLFTGKVERVDQELIGTLLHSGIVPVVPPLGFDDNGRTYRINSDAIAVEIAESLNATKVLFLTNRDGIEMNGRILRQIAASELEENFRGHRDWFKPPTISNAEHAIRACSRGVQRVHVINGCVEEGLLAEVFSNEGIGTLVYANEYQAIRRAAKKDIRAILALIRQSVESDELVRRTRASIEKQLADYYVFEIDQNVVGCVARHFFPENKRAELACLYVNSSYENQGIGAKLCAFVESQAREQEMPILFCLSTQSYTYFTQKLGFREGGSDDLPPARRERYEQSGRNSKILIKSLLPTAALPVAHEVTTR